MTVPAEGLSSVRNAARLLKVFLSREESIGVSELGRRLGLGKSSVHRLLTTLCSEGLIEQDPATGGYRLGLVVFELGEAVRVQLDLHAACGPVLVSLREQTGESSQVGVFGHEVVYVVLLAHLPEAERREVLAAAPMTAMTPNTVTDRDQLIGELILVRRRGWAEAVDRGGLVT